MTGDQVKTLIDRLEQRLTNMLQVLVEFTPITRTSADGSNDGVNVPAGDNGVVDPTDRQRAVRRVSPWGIASRPVSGVGVLAALMKAVGSPFGGMVVGIATDKYGPQNLNEGEICIYNKVSGVQILLDQNGKISINAASGEDIVFNGGTAKVARVGDHTTAHTHAMTFALTANITTGAVTGTITAANANPTIAEGAPNVKA